MTEWYPIFEWTEAEVWARIAAAGTPSAIPPSGWRSRKAWGWSVFLSTLLAWLPGFADPE